MIIFRSWWNDDAASPTFPAKHTVPLKKKEKRSMWLYRKKKEEYSGFSGKRRKKHKRDEAEEHNILAFWASRPQFSIFKSNVFPLPLQGVLEVVWNNSTDNLPLDSRLRHCYICTRRILGGGREIQSEKPNQRANSIQRTLYLCYQVLHVVVCLSKNCFKIMQCEEGRSLALLAKHVQSPI